MAQLDTGDSKGGKGGKVRSKKQNSSVDLTAMVDLAFLLITFFMLTTSLSKPQSMDLAMPDKGDKNKPEEDILISEERTLNLVLGPKDELKYYMGQLASPKEGPKDLTYTKESLRKLILDKIQSVPLATRTAAKPNGEPLIVLIKASKESTYKNLVDVLDEMAIGKVKVYAIVDITKEDNQLFGE
ncbi:biopolymer transporter ExbD [Flavobacterium antarcticum]|uniref:ExbD/TolR family protein n=1 Tax=Flavobacterium antarcticum TaxID=271155 RepID=UPI0003B55D4B|nr:biopolymer transporter ExbD [Flavobacterium antarcticum]